MRRERVFRECSRLLEIYSSKDIISRFILILTDELADKLSPHDEAPADHLCQRSAFMLLEGFCIVKL